MPIELPPGVNGIEPNLSITYTSQGGNGLLGVGASLSGLSAITRCGANLYDDGYIDPVDYDDNDKYCLDGEPLVPIAGVPGEYRTKHNSAVRVKTLSDNGKPYFKVYFAGGRIAYYGSVKNARTHQTNLQSPIHAWWLVSTSDRTKNKIEYTYGVGRRISSILYDAVTDQTGSGAQYQIDFIYEDRPDIYLGYGAVDGPYTTKDQRLSEIQVKPSFYQTAMETYHFGYTTDVLKRSTLHYVQKCDGTGQCLPATTLYWNNPTHEKVAQAPSFKDHIQQLVNSLGNGYDNYKQSLVDGDLLSRFKLGDFDGNGLVDVYWVEGTDGSAVRDTIFLNQGDGHFTQTTGLVTAAYEVPLGNQQQGKRQVTLDFSHTIDRLIVGDFNGDGLSDLYFWGQGEGLAYDVPNETGYSTMDKPGQNTTGYIYLSKGDGNFQRAGRIPLVIFRKHLTGRLRTGDFDGDQITDLMWVDGDNQSLPLKIYLMNQQGQVKKIINGPTHYMAGNKDELGTGRSLSMIRVNDFNRDGISDIYQFAYNGNDKIHFFKSDGSYQSVSVTGFQRSYIDTDNNTDYQRVHLVDLNSDGFLDVYEVVNHVDGLDKIYLGAGSGHFKYHGTGINSAIHSRPSVDIARVKFADMNGDGLVDLYYINGWGSDIREHHIHYNQISNPGTFGSAENTGVYGFVHETYGHNNIQSVQLFDFDGDGASDIHILPLRHSHNTVRPYEGIVHFWRNESQLVKSITNGLGKTTHFTYATMIDPNLYTPGNTYNTYPNVALRAPIPLVQSIAHDNGVGGFNHTSYHYQNMRVNKQGAGALGFEHQWATDDTTGIVQHTQLSQNLDNRSVGQPLLITTTLNGIELSRTLSEYSYQTHQGIGFPQLKASTQIQRDLNGAHIQTTATRTWYSHGGTSDIVPDRTETCQSNQDLGAITQVKYCGNFTHQHFQENSFTYWQESAHDHMGPMLKTKINLVKNQAGYAYLEAGQYQTLTEYDYYPSGLIKTETFEKNHAHWTKKEYFYNKYGQTTKTRLSGADIATRSNTQFYQARRLASKTNALGHTTQYYYTNEPRFWLPTEVKSPNGISTHTSYDTLGRPYQTRDVHNNTKTTQKYWCDSCSPHFQSARIKVVTSETGTADKITYLDKLGRAMGTETQGLYEQADIRTILTQTVYNPQGQIVQAIGPYFFGDLDKPTVYSQYDELGRPTQVKQKQRIHTGGTNTSLEWTETRISYLGRETRYTDALNRTRKEIKDAAGQLIQAIDAHNESIHYTYDANAKLVKTQDPRGNQVTISYDKLGRKTAMNDPDQGNWIYSYYADGQLKRQTDAKNQTTEIDYDLLGRMTQRRDMVSGQTTQTSTWTYDQGNKALGKLTGESSPGFSRSITYNNEGQVSTTNTSIDGSNYTQTTNYDSRGRVQTQSYPENISVTNHYHASLGILEKITDQSGKKLWQVTASNAAGQVEAYQLGNNFSVTKMYDPYSRRITQLTGYTGAQTKVAHQYAWDSTGNLAFRQDQTQNLLESFNYDNLDRLVQNQLSGSTNRTDSITYNAIGNITSKSGLGSYTYGQKKCGRIPGPHAVTSISNKGNLCYDANGNMTQGDGKTIQYTTFNKPNHITNGSQTTQFWYDGNRKRYKRYDGHKTTYYIGNYQKVVGNSGVITHQYRIGDFAVIEKKKGVVTNRFQVTDHLGSIIAAVDTNGTITDRFSYDPWGLRRVLNGDIYNGSNLLPLASGHIPRGYTGHEHIDWFGMIHMGGRVYMPEIGRFVSPDPFVQSPSNIQNYNRYTYVNNNPLRYTDPSGYFMKKLFDTIDPYIQPMFGMAFTILSGGAFGGMGFGPIAAGAMGGSLGGAVTGGAQGAKAGFISGGLFGSLHGKFQVADSASKGAKIAAGAKKVAAHGLVGGLNSKLNGGKFAHGFAAAGFTQGMRQLGWLDSIANADVFGGSKFGHAVAAGFAGGTGSYLAGGDFGFGAVQGVMSHFLNDLAKARDSAVIKAKIGNVLAAGYDTELGFSAEFSPNKEYTLTYGENGGSVRVTQAGYIWDISSSALKSIGANIINNKVLSISLTVQPAEGGSLNISGSFAYSTKVLGVSFGGTRNINLDNFVINNSGLLGNAARAMRNRRKVIDCIVMETC